MYCACMVAHVYVQLWNTNEFRTIFFFFSFCLFFYIALVHKLNKKNTINVSSFCSKALRVLYFSNVTCHTLWFMNNKCAQNMKRCVCKSGWHHFTDSFQIVFIIGGVVVVVVVVTFNVMQNLVNPLIFPVLKNEENDIKARLFLKSYVHTIWLL